MSLTPLALVARASLGVAKGAYALLGVACVLWSLVRLRGPTWGTTALALAAVCGPLQANFEYLNMHAILLALVVAAGADLTSGRDARAGTWIGLATALKLFPGLLLVYCAARRRWRACAVGVVVSVGLTVLSLLAIGGADAAAAAQRWWTLDLAGEWLSHLGNQSLLALVLRAGGSHGLALALGLGLCALVAAALRHEGDPSHDTPAAEVGIVTLLAVLLAPIAWSHAFLLGFPAWVAALDARQVSRRSARTVALLAAGIATSGVLMIWWRPLKLMLLRGSIYTWGGLLLLGVMLLDRASSGRATDPGARAPVAP